MNSAGPDLVGLYVQVLGTLLYCLVFLFLWRQSGILYFGYWSLAWGLQSVALLCLRVYFAASSAFWLSCYALLEFAFALVLMAAARAGPSKLAGTWKSLLRVLLGFPLFLAIVYSLGLQTSFEGFQTLHGLILGSIYLYTFFMIRGNVGVGGQLFRVSLLCLALAFYPRWTHHERLGYLTPESDEQMRRVEVCDTCRGYLKGVTTVRPLVARAILLDDLMTVHLDVAALERGYNRPERPGYALEARLRAFGIPKDGA